jgi:phosphoribosylformylglycinamidine synthase
MVTKPHALLLKFPGTNCDAESARALEAAGFTTQILPASQLGPDSLEQVDLLMLSGGFSYGDYVMAGRLAQLRVEERLGLALNGFVEEGGFVLGVCNGFQILTKLGLLPAGSLIDNSSGRFICRWTELHVENCDSPPLVYLPGTFELPIAHAEGRFVAPDGMVQEYFDNGLVTLTYGDDVNGSERQIAGIQNQAGNVFGLMPHPERFLYRQHHYDPDWLAPDQSQWGWGYHFFRGIRDHVVGEAVVESLEESAL